MKFLKALFHFIVIFVLTVVTQIGGLLYLFCLILFRKKKRRKYLYFFGIYAVCTIFVVPYIAPLFGREKIRNTPHIEARNFFYTWANRNYVRPEMNTALDNISLEFAQKYPDAKLKYLDANFPFIDKFPLWPHLSHNDGKKLDISLVYEVDQKITNKKPSVSGYGVFAGPKPSEYNQIKRCIARGNWQYDAQKYVTFGSINKDIQFSEKGTKALINFSLKQPAIGKLFIEPHLKHRLRLTNSKIRFHGCQAVRHDDHIHIQLK